MTKTSTFVALTDVICVGCGITFAIPKPMEEARRFDGKDFWCPNGHKLSWNQNTGRSKLERELAAERARLDQAKAEIEDRNRRDEMRLRQLSAARGQVTRIKNRVGNGVCPCCNRSFGNLHRHMQTKHPGWKKPEGGDA